MAISLPIGNNNHDMSAAAATIPAIGIAALAVFISRSIVETHMVAEYEQGVTKTKNGPQLLFNFQVADNKILN